MTILFKKIPIKLTKKAFVILSKIIKKKNKFRIYITSGGCNGFKYKFKLDNKILKGDIIIKNLGINIIIDFITLQYLFNSKIDYINSLNGSQFKIINNNIKKTCICGLSYNIR